MVAQNNSKAQNTVSKKASQQASKTYYSNPKRNRTNLAMYHGKPKRSIMNA